MIKTNKDLVFWGFVSIWLCTTLIPYFITKDTTLSIVVINPIFMIIAWIFVIIKNNNNKFNFWLKKKIKH